LTVLSLKSCQGKFCLGSPALVSCPGSPTYIGNCVLAVLAGNIVLAFLICMPSSSCPVLLVPFGLPCPDSAALAVLVYLSCLLEILLCLFHSGCPVLAALNACPFLAVVSFLFCTSCLILAVLCWLSFPESPVMLVLFCLSHSDCSFPAILLELSFSGCQILNRKSHSPVLFLPVLFLLSCSA
jgi:hypothetical protein